jgi:hypothetical protein
MSANSFGLHAQRQDMSADTSGLHARRPDMPADTSGLHARRQNNLLALRRKGPQFLRSFPPRVGSLA